MGDALDTVAGFLKLTTTYSQRWCTPFNWGNEPT